MSCELRAPCFLALKISDETTEPAARRHGRRRFRQHDLVPPKNGVNPARAAPGALSDGSILIQPFCLTYLHHVDLGFNFGVRVK